MTRILVTGSRDWVDVSVLEAALLQAWERTGRVENPVLVSGANPKGADALAEEFWRRRGWPVERHPANWGEHGRAAGPIRNSEMVKSGVDMCVAVILDGSKGASHCVKQARKAGVPVILVTYYRTLTNVEVEKHRRSVA